MAIQGSAAKTTVQLRPTGKSLWLEIKPAPRLIDIYGGPRKLASLKGNKRTRFDISRYAIMAPGDRLRLVVHDESGGRHSHQVDISDYRKSSHKALQPGHTAAPGAIPSKPQSPPFDDRMPSIGSQVTPQAPRPDSSGDSSGQRSLPLPKLQSPRVPAPTGIPPAIQSDSRRLPTTAQARITNIDPRPAVVGQALTIRGTNFGREGEVTLEIAGLRLRPRVSRWSASEVHLTVPAELARVIGSREQSGRIWIKTSDSGATSRIRVAPDPASITPVIRRAPLSVQPGEEIVIEGQYFFNSPQGRVTLRCPRGNPGSEITNWSDTRIRVIPVASLTERVGAMACELTVINHRDLQARSDIALEMVLAQEQFRMHRYWDFGREGDIVIFNGETLVNGWKITDVSFRVEPGDGVFNWNRSPHVGGTETACRVIANSDTARRGRRRVTVTIDIEGPAGLPYRR